MAMLKGAIYQSVSTKPRSIDWRDFLPFSDDAHEIPDDLGAKERLWMQRLQRAVD